MEHAQRLLGMVRYVLRSRSLAGEGVSLDAPALVEADGNGKACFLREVMAVIMMWAMAVVMIGAMVVVMMGAMTSTRFEVLIAARMNLARGLKNVGASVTEMSQNTRKRVIGAF